MSKRRPPLQVMVKPTPATEVKSIQRHFENQPNPETTQQLQDSEDISDSFVQNKLTRQFEVEILLHGVQREHVIVTLIRSLRTILIAASSRGINSIILKKILCAPQVKFDTIKIDMNLDGLLTISAKEGFNLLESLGQEISQQSSIDIANSKPSSSTFLKKENTYVIDQSKNLDCKLIKDGTTPGGSTDMTQDIISTLLEDGLTWKFELPIPQGYAPEEMSTEVSPETQTVAIVGKRWGAGGKEPGKKKWLEFWRRFQLPENVKPESISTTISEDRKSLIITAKTEEVVHEFKRKESTNTNTASATNVVKPSHFTRVLP